jgi:hypothetical protein
MASFLARTPRDFGTSLRSKSQEESISSLQQTARRLGCRAAAERRCSPDPSGHVTRFARTRCEVCLTPDSDLEPIPSNLPGPFRILDDPTPVPVETAGRLSELLLANEPYLQSYKMCVFQPGVAFRFWRGAESVDVLVCFSCSDLAFQALGRQRRSGPS